MTTGIIPWLPNANNYELLYLTTSIVSILVLTYSISRTIRDIRIVRGLPASSDKVVMLYGMVRNLCLRTINVVAIFALGSYAAVTPPLTVPVHPLIRLYALVLALIAVNFSVMSSLELWNRRAAMQAAKRQRQGQIDTTVDAVIVIDAESVVRSINKAAERLFGYTATEMVGQPITAFMPERYRDVHLRGIARYRRAGTTTILGRPIIVDILTKGGSEQAIELIITETRGRQGPRFTGIMRPVNVPEPDADVVVEGSHAAVGNADREGTPAS